MKLNTWALLFLLVFVACMGCAKFQAFKHTPAAPTPTPTPECPKPPVPPIKEVKCYKHGQLVLTVYVTDILSMKLVKCDDFKCTVSK